MYKVVSWSSSVRSKQQWHQSVDSQIDISELNKEIPITMDLRNERCDNNKACEHHKQEHLYYEDATKA